MKNMEYKETTNNIEITPQLIDRESLRFGALVKVIEDWQNIHAASRRHIVGAKFVMATLAMLAGNAPKGAGDILDSLSTASLELYVKRELHFENGSIFAFPKWKEDVTPFNRDLGDMGLFSVFASIGFHMNFDIFAIDDAIFPYRDLVLSSATEGYLLGSEASLAVYEEMKKFYSTNPNAEALFEAICVALESSK